MITGYVSGGASASHLSAGTLRRVRAALGWEEGDSPEITQEVDEEINTLTTWELLALSSTPLAA